MNGPTVGSRRKGFILKSELTLCERIHGVLLGTAVGDAIGLPMEGLSGARIDRLGWVRPLRHRFLFGRGMVSDDTEHTLMAAQALLTTHNHAEFQKQFARGLRWWFLALPAGVGMATARACLRLWLGFSPNRSGVFSAGNGGAMRSAILGAYFSQAAERRVHVKALVEVTHTDPKAYHGALAVAEMVALSCVGMPRMAAVFAQLAQVAPEDAAWQRIVAEMEESISRGDSVSVYWERFGVEKGVSGYVYHTVPVALYAWQHHQGDFQAAVSAVIALGGDTDTVAAITGALCGGTHGVGNIPDAWVEGLRDWPRGRALIDEVADRLSKENHEAGAVGYAALAIPFRNLLFLTTVLMHGLLRYIPGGLKLLGR